MAKQEFCRGAVALELGVSQLLMGVKEPLPAEESAAVRALKGAVPPLLLGMMFDDWVSDACESCGLPRGVGGNLELDKPCARHHASSNVAGERLQP